MQNITIVILLTLSLISCARNDFCDSTSEPLLMPPDSDIPEVYKQDAYKRMKIYINNGCLDD